MTIYRNKQHADMINSGWADYAYSFTPLDDSAADEAPTGDGGGVYGTCRTDVTNTPIKVDVPDGSKLDETELGETLLFVPGQKAGYTPRDLAHKLHLR